MGNFFAELKRRNVYRVAAAYAVVAWVALQLVNNVAPLLRLPDWAGTFFLMALLVGFPIALVFAWTLELKSPSAAERTPAGTIDIVLAGALLAVIAILVYQEIAPQQGTGAQPGLEAARNAAASPAGISIAVPPSPISPTTASRNFSPTG